MNVTCQKAMNAKKLIGILTLFLFSGFCAASPATTPTDSVTRNSFSTGNDSHP